MQTDLQLVAQPTAVRCVRDLVLVRLPQWGLSHIAGVIEALATDLVRSLVSTIGSARPAHTEADDAVPLIRCVLWFRSGVVGFAVEDPTVVAIPMPPAAPVYPTVRWDETRLPIGKATWFIVPVQSTNSIPWQPVTSPTTRRFRHV
ncbi:hypothetical protein ACWDSJ_09145 [Nocardia sp. NPDC003482]